MYKLCLNCGKFHTPEEHRVENLEWVTSSENQIKSYIKGRYKRGEKKQVYSTAEREVAMKDIKLEGMTIETRKRHPIYIENGKKYYIEVNMGPFTQEEYDIKIQQLKDLGAK